MISFAKSRVAVVIPCYRVRAHIKNVILSIPDCVERIYAIDDCCPEKTGNYLQDSVHDSRLVLLNTPANVGVGGAVKTGYKIALEDQMDIVVKVDGDGQMDASLIPLFCAPIAAGHADYTKGNRFYDLTCIRQMPPLRIFGNAVLSFITKLSTGYWGIFDVNNGFVAISAQVLRHVDMEKVSNRYFFETDMLFRLGLLRANVVDIPMDAQYADEVSNLKIGKVWTEFAWRHTKNLFKRIVYNYFLRDFSVASLQLTLGSLLFLSGAAAGAIVWVRAIQTMVPTPLGTIMLIATALFSGLLLLLAFVSYDMSNSPQKPIQTYLPGAKRYGIRSSK